MNAAPMQAVRGMNDVLPADAARWQFVEGVIREVTANYGYREIRPPLVEKSALFCAAIGEVTDIVEKEMYSFADRGGESLSLRPEATAGCMRAGIEHGLFHNSCARLWYAGPMFRRERPQKGRYRQFHQFGVEAVGWRGPDIDAEILLLGARFFRRLGIRGLRLEINTLGGAGGESRARYRAALVDYLQTNHAALDEDSRRRLHANPLRVLDSKNPAMAGVIAGAPQITDYLNTGDEEFFSALRGLLDAAKVEYAVNPRLVRGLDYYTGPVFEFVADSESLGAQNAVCAGGRYDGLAETLGGRPAPAAGFACGLERIIALAAGEGGDEAAPDVYLIDVDGGDGAAAGEALAAAETMRDAGLAIQCNCGGGAMKNQMKRAHRSGAAFAVILAADERAAGKVTVKPMRGGGQRTVGIKDAVQIIKDQTQWP